MAICFCKHVSKVVLLLYTLITLTYWVTYIIGKVYPLLVVWHIAHHSTAHTVVTHFDCLLMCDSFLWCFSLVSVCVGPCGQCQMCFYSSGWVGVLVPKVRKGQPLSSSIAHFTFLFPTSGAVYHHQSLGEHYAAMLALQNIQMQSSIKMLHFTSMVEQMILYAGYICELIEIMTKCGIGCQWFHPYSLALQLSALNLCISHMHKMVIS